LKTPKSKVFIPSPSNSLDSLSRFPGNIKQGKGTKKRRKRGRKKERAIGKEMP